MTQEIAGETITIIPQSTTEWELIQKIRQLDESTQKQRLQYIEKLVIRPQGISGAEAIRIAREINFDPESLKEMEEAINEMYGQEAIIEDIRFDE